MALAAALVGCGRPPAPTHSWFDDHAATGEPAAEQRRVPALSAAEAAAGLAAAIAEHRSADVVIYANRLVAAGGELDGERAAAVTTAIDDLSSDQLIEVWDELDPVAPAPRVALRRALLAEHRGEDAEAGSWLARVGDDLTIAESVTALSQRIAARSQVEPRRIAVLLPLSGRFSRIGVEIRAAVEVAAAGREVELHFLDTAGEPAGAVDAVDRAAALHAVAILGPVGGREAAAAAGRAVELGLPIALLSPSEGGGAPEVGVFRLWSSPEWEASEAVRLAIRLGYDRLAILAPRDDQGDAQVAAFTDAVAATRGAARLVAAGRYDPTATDLEPDLKAFLGLDPRQNDRLRRHLQRYGVKQGWKTFSPALEFDLVFVPDDYQRAALVVAYLPFFNVEVQSREVMDIDLLKRKHGGRVPQVVQLLGSSGWHHEGLIPRGGAVVDGALVLDVFTGGDNEEFVTEASARFAAAFTARNHRPPGAVAAQAYDAARLVVLAAERAARTEGGGRAALVAALARAEVAEGACGPAAVTPTGEVAREAILLKVDGGGFVLHDD